MSKDVDQRLAHLRDTWRARKTAKGLRIGGAVLGVLVLTALALAGVFVALASTAGSPGTAFYATQSGGGEVFTIPVGTETIVRDGKTLRVVRTERGETVTRNGRQVILPGETIRRFGTSTVRDTNTVRDTVTIRETVTKTETVTQTVTEPPVTVTVEVTVTEDNGKP
jgi:hypothetical protein